MKIFIRLLILCVFTLLIAVCPAGEAMVLVKLVTQLDAARVQAAENDADAAQSIWKKCKAIFTADLRPTRKTLRHTWHWLFFMNIRKWRTTA